jgi:hypothetical protein
MDAARGPPPSVGTTPAPGHGTLSATGVAAARSSPPTTRRHQRLWLVTALAVTSAAEDSPSGLWRTIGNRVGC